jgi:4,5-epoxidase
MTLALELARRGVACRVIERAEAPARTSRALAIQPRTLELLDVAGVAGEIESRGIRQTGIQLRSGGRLLARLEHGRFPYDATCLAQPEVEEVLREALSRNGVGVEWGTELTGVEQDPDGVRVATNAGPISASWLVGCDGAHSRVRRLLGVDFEGSALPETNLMADIEPEWDLDGGDVRIFFHPDGVLVILHQPAGVWRLIASVRDPEKTPTEDFFGEVLARRAGLTPRRMRIRWMSAFHVQSRLASSYRDRRVFLGGDAAHVHSPVGGQGMNVGMQDAINLGWKLAQALKGSPGQLLESYESERRPVARTVLRATEPLTRIGVASGAVQRFARDRVLPIVLSLPPVRRSMSQQASGIGLSYSKSPLSMAGGGGRSPFQRGYYSGSWELFRDSAGAGVLVRPDTYIAARFNRPDPKPAEDYLAERIGAVDLKADGRPLPAEERPSFGRVAVSEPS